MAKANKTQATNNTVVTFLLDRSGSMESIRDDTIGAFNTYIDTLRPVEGVDMTLLQFDSSSLDKTFVNLPADKVPNLTRETFVPRASTPLIDAACKTIKAVEACEKVISGAKVVICIQTDGQENASVEYTWNDLNALIKEKTALGWQFNFMGSGLDAYAQGKRMGISAFNTVSYDSQDAGKTKAVFAASASNTADFARGLRSDVTYSAKQRVSAGDRWADPSLVTPPVTPTKPVAPRRDAIVQKPAARARKALVDDIVL